MIENKEKRIVHFLFKAPFVGNESEFSLRLRSYLTNTLDLYSEKQEERMEDYINKIKDEENADDLPPHPVRTIES